MTRAGDTALLLALGAIVARLAGLMRAHPFLR